METALAYTPSRQGSDAGFLFVPPAILSKRPSSVGSYPGATLAGTQAEFTVEDFCFMNGDDAAPPQTTQIFNTKNTQRDSKGRFASWAGVPMEKRFWSKVDRDGPTPPHCPELGPCWLWTGFINKYGYGDYTPGNLGRDKAHRWAWRITNGPIPPDKPHVLHRCDNPPCVRPSHLFVGTHADNMADLKQKGRWTPRVFPTGDDHHMRRHPELAIRGEQQHCAKLTERKVREIRRLFASGHWTRTALGARYGVTRTLIGMVVARRIWKHVPEEPL